MSAIQNGDIENVKLLLDNGTDPNFVDSYGYTALIKASIEGKRDIFELLLDRGADPNLKDRYGQTDRFR